METKKITQEMKQLLDQPLPKEALKPHPTKKFLSVINAIYVTERLNDVFGVGSWHIKAEFIEKNVKNYVTKDGKDATSTMIVVKTTFEIPEYDIYYECYGGNDNEDIGDAYKGAVTDALTKIGSYLGIGAHVWKNKPYVDLPQQITPNTKQAAPTPQQQLNNIQKPQPVDKARRREKIVAYLNSLDFAELQNTLDYFNIEDVARITDQQVNAVADYLNAQRRQK